MRKKTVYDKTLVGVEITDELHSDFGSDAISLYDTNEDTGHQFVRSGLTIRTAAGGGGTLLEEGVDYILGDELPGYSEEVSDELGSTVQIYRTIQITNVTYQSGDLYFSYFGHGVAVKSSIINRNTSFVLPVDADYTVDDDVYGDVIILGTGGIAGIQITTPDAALNKNVKIRIVKADAAAGVCTVVRSGSDTFSGATAFPLRQLYDFIEIVSNGTNWFVIDSLSTLDSAALANNQVQTLAHSLATKPSHFWISLLCISAELGYSAGDEVLIVPNYSDGTNSRRWGVSADTTNFKTMIGAQDIVICQKDTGAAVSTDETKWKIRIRYSI
jgi:hypothetical protein